MARRTIQVAKADAGLRLDRFLARTVPGLSPERARTLCEEKRVFIRAKAAPAARKLWGDEAIEIELPAPRPVTAAPDAPEIPILFEDSELIVVDKPAGLVVEREGNGRSVVEIVGARVPGCEAEGWAAPGVAHRLDRDTTGCLALARSDEALASLKAAFERKEIRKRYLALVLGDPPDELRLESAYGRDPKDPRRFTTRVQSARRAALSFVVRERFGGRKAALLEVSLETGRTHQIRAQLADASFPVLGDEVYGSNEARSMVATKSLGRQALHAFRLELPKRPVIEAPVPCDFARACELLRAGE